LRFARIKIKEQIIAVHINTNGLDSLIILIRLMKALSCPPHLRCAVTEQMEEVKKQQPMEEETAATAASSIVPAATNGSSEVNLAVTWEGCSVLLDINDGDRLVFSRLSPSAYARSLSGKNPTFI
jgi:hypothetical protein